MKLPFSTLKRSACSVLLLFTLAGCATQGFHEATQSPPKSVMGRTQKIDLKIVSKIPEAQEAVANLETKIRERLQNRFQFTSDPSASNVLTLKLEVTDFNKISTAKRIFLGGLGGIDLVGVKGQVVSSPDNKQIGNFTARGESRAGGILGETGQQRSAEAVAEEIEKYLLQ